MTSQDIDFVIRTQDNPEGLTELLFSIVDVHPDAQITIADTGQELSRAFYKKLNEQLIEAGLVSRIRVHFIGHNASFTTSLNHAMRMTKRRYMLLLDDTMVFTSETDISKMEAVMRMEKEIGIVCGMTQEHAIQDVQTAKGPDGEEIRFSFASRLGAFALYNSDIFHAVSWKQTERPLEVFFNTLTTKTVFKVLVTDSIIGNSAEVVRENKEETPAEEGAGDSPEGDSDGATTEPDVSDSDAGDEPGSTSVPSGETEKESDSSSAGRRSRSRSRSTRGKSN